MIVLFSILLLTALASDTSCNTECQLCLETTNSCVKCRPGFFLNQGRCEQTIGCDKAKWRQYNSACVDYCDSLQLWNSESEENICFQKIRCPEYSKSEGNLDFWQVNYFYNKGMREQVKVKVQEDKLTIVSTKNEIINEQISQYGIIIDIQIFEDQNNNCYVFGITSQSLIFIQSSLNQLIIKQSEILQLSKGYLIRKLFVLLKDSSIFLITVSLNNNEILIQSFNSQRNQLYEILNSKINSIKTVLQINYVDETLILGIGESFDASFITTFSLKYDINVSKTLIEYQPFCSIPDEQQQLDLIYIRSKQVILISSTSYIYLSTASQSLQLSLCTNLISEENIIQILVINNESLLLIISQYNILLYSLQNLFDLKNILQDKKDNISQYQLSSCLSFQLNQVVCYDITKFNLYMITISTSNSLDIQSLINLRDSILHISIDYPSIFIQSQSYSIFFPEQQSTSLDLGSCYYNINYTGDSNEFQQNVNQIILLKQNEPFEELQLRFLYISLETDPSQNDINFLSNVKNNYILVFQPIILKQQLKFSKIQTLKNRLILQNFELFIDSPYYSIQQSLDFLVLINVNIIVSKNASIQLNYYDSFILQSVSFFNTSIIKPLFILNSYQSIKMTNVTIQNCALYAPLIQVYESNQIFINGINILNSYLYINPIILAIDTISFSFLNSNFINNRYIYPLSVNYGLILSIYGVDSMNIDNVIFKSNTNIRVLDYYLNFQQQSNGDYVIRSKSQLAFQNSTLESNICNHCQLVSIKASTLYLSDNTFINNYSVLSNGTVYIEQASSYLQRCKFDNNTAFSGGAIFLNRTTSAQIVSSLITKNTALTTGGGITIVAAKGVLNSAVIQYNTAIIGGGVRIEEGRLFFVQWDSNTIISHNSGTIYGQNVISRLLKREIFINNVKMTEFGKEEFILLNQERSKVADNLVLQKALKIDNIQSGGAFNFLVKLYDDEEKQLYLDPTIILAYPLKIQQEIESIAGILSFYLVQVVGVLEIDRFSQEFGGYLTRVIIYGNPNQTLPIFLIENFIEFVDLKSQISRFRNLQEQIIEESPRREYETDNQQNSSDQFLNIKRMLGQQEVINILSSQFVIATGIYLSFNECVKGEIYKGITTQLISAVCLPCPLESYTFSHNDTVCKKCPDTAEICQNSTIILKDGYWRQNKTSDDIYLCKVKFNKCQEYSLRDSQQQCTQGYIGPLCEGCDITGQYWNKSYTKRSSIDECVECDNGQYSQVQIILIFILTSIYLTYLIYISINNNVQYSIAYYLRLMGIAPISTSQKKASSQFIKLLVHYLQIIAVISEISFSLPSAFSFLPTFSGSPSSSMILYSSCFYNQLGLKDIMKYKVIQSAFLPVLYSLSVILIWFFLKFIKKQLFKIFQEQFMQSKIIFLLTFFQPDTVMFLLSAIGCRKLGDKSYLIADANYECYDTQNYKSFLYSFVIPFFLIWSLFPIYILVFLYRKRFNLNSVKTIKAYGYLYLEYKPNCYFFELIRSFFKVTIVAIYTLINTNTALKLDCIMILISLYIIYSNKLKPFQNNLEGKIDFITHLQLLVILFLLVLNQNWEDNYEITKNINLICTLFNLLYILFMISIIIITKLKEYPKLFNLILSILKQRISKLAPFFDHFKVNTPEASSKVFKQWKFLSKNMHNITVNHITHINFKPQRNTNNIKQDSQSSMILNKLEINALKLQQQKQQQVNKKSMNFNCSSNAEISSFQELSSFSSVNEEHQKSSVFCELKQYSTPNYQSFSKLAAFSKNRLKIYDQIG